MDTKICKKCEVEKELGEFARKSKTTGLISYRTQCKSCVHVMQTKARLARNPYVNVRKQECKDIRTNMSLQTELVYEEIDTSVSVAYFKFYDNEKYVIITRGDKKITKKVPKCSKEDRLECTRTMIMMLYQMIGITPSNLIQL